MILEKAAGYSSTTIITSLFGLKRFLSKISLNLEIHKFQGASNLVNTVDDLKIRSSNPFFSPLPKHICELVHCTYER